MSYPEPHLGFTQWQLAEKIARAKRGKSKETEPKNAAALQPSWCWSWPEHISLFESGEGPGSEVLLNRTFAASIRPKKPVGRRERSSARPSSLSSAPSTLVLRPRAHHVGRLGVLQREEHPGSDGSGEHDAHEAARC